MGEVAESRVNVAAVVEPSNCLAVCVVPDVERSIRTEMSKNSACASVGAEPSALYDSVIAVVRTSATEISLSAAMSVRIWSMSVPACAPNVPAAVWPEAASSQTESAICCVASAPSIW